MNRETDVTGDQSLSAEQVVEQGKKLHMAGDLAKAGEIYRQVLRDNPEHPDALLLLGVIAHQQRRDGDAVDLISKALKARPGFDKAHNNLGLAYKGLGETGKAIECYEAALAITPDFALAHFNLGVALEDSGRLRESIESLSRAIALEPELAEAYYYLAKALKRQGRMEEAIENYRRALAINANFAEAHNNLGNILRRRGLIGEALSHYRDALAIKPDFAEAHSNILTCLNYEDVVSQAEILEEARRWDSRHAASFKEVFSHSNDRSPERRIRVGYVSPDMYKHSVSYFLEPLLAEHDPSGVETYCYADVAKPDDMTARLKGHADHWRDTAGMADQALAETIHADGIDILVDLTGHTANNRLLVFARKPAPLQVTWLGYPNTTGLATMDYRLVDRITDPVNEGSEKLLYLPNGFFCYSPAEEAPSDIPPRAEGPLTFGSFNNSIKMSMACIRVWARILAEAPEARLLLKSNHFIDPKACDYIKAGFADHGIEPERLELVPYKDSREEHHALYAQVDVALDPFPYNGTTTTCEALWMGVPVVTLRGDHHRSRVGTSILSRIGLDECVADDEDAYVSIATALARDTERRARLRNGMRDRMAPLCNAPSFARDMEAAYRSIWRGWCQVSA